MYYCVLCGIVTTPASCIKYPDDVTSCVTILLEEDKKLSCEFTFAEKLQDIFLIHNAHSALLHGSKQVMKVLQEW